MTVLKLIANKGFISYNKTIARRLGVNEAILLGELCSIFDYFHYSEFYISQERIANDTALSVKQIRTSLINLEKAGVITITKKGQPCKNWYFINEDVVTEILETAEEEIEEPLEEDVQFAQKGELDVPKVPNKIGKKVTTRCDKKGELLINNNTANNNTLNNNTNSKSHCDDDSSSQKSETKPKKQTFPKDYYSKVIDSYSANYLKLYHDIPAIDYKTISRLLKQRFETFGFDAVLKAVADSINHKWLVESAKYSFQTVLSSKILTDLINGNYERVGEKPKTRGNTFYKGFDKESLKKKDFFSDLEELRNGTTN